MLDQNGYKVLFYGSVLSDPLTGNPITLDEYMRISYPGDQYWVNDLKPWDDLSVAGYSFSSQNSDAQGYVFRLNNGNVAN